MRLNLGCSDNLLGGWLNVDIARPDPLTVENFQQADLALPWPWADSSVDEIYAADIFEHIGDCDHMGQNCLHCWPRGAADQVNPHELRHWSGRIHVMNESWRVLKPGGRLTMICPDAAKGAGQWQDPTHVTPWTPNGLQYFADGSPAHKRFAAAYGITARFKVLGATENKYEEWAGSPARILADDPPETRVYCEVWKFTAVLEAVKDV